MGTVYMYTLHIVITYVYDCIYTCIFLHNPQWSKGNVEMSAILVQQDLPMSWLSGTKFAVFGLGDSTYSDLEWQPELHPIARNAVQCLIGGISMETSMETSYNLPL